MFSWPAPQFPSNQNTTFRCRDIGLGVVLFLVDCMEEQEWKEVLLGWMLLDRDGACGGRELDRRWNDQVQFQRSGASDA